MAVSINWECPKNESPTILGSVLGPLIFGSSRLDLVDSCWESCRTTDSPLNYKTGSERALESPETIGQFMTELQVFVWIW